MAHVLARPKQYAASVAHLGCAVPEARLATIPAEVPPAARPQHSAGVANWRDGTPSPRRRVVLYSPGMVGLGHLRRNLLIAQTLACSRLQAITLMIAEAREACAYPMPHGMDCLTLPALRKEPDGQCRARSLGIPLDELVGLRAQAIRAALAAFQPDVLIVDHLPGGALGELEPALQQLRARGHTRCVLGLRDVLEDPATVRHEWRAAGAEAAIRQFYDAVWVYGDPAVYDAVRAYGLAPEVAAKARYTGYLDQRMRLAFDDDEGEPALARLALPAGPLVLCLVGGGQDGDHLADAFAAATLPAETTGVILTGPFMAAEVQERLRWHAARNPRLRVIEFLKEPTRLLARADRVIAMGGYNTICEVLSFEKQALIVPRAGRRREQLIRAERLRQIGLVDVLRAEDVTPAALTAWLARHPVPGPPIRPRIDLNGLARLPGLLADMLPEPGSALGHPPHEQEIQYAAG